jgi:CheY-like chemotaxis protein
MARGDETRVEEVDAAVLVVRDLVRPRLRDDPSGLDRAESRARYCHLLGVRCGLSPLDARCLVLAAWLSCLGHDHPVGVHLADQHGLTDILQSGARPAEGQALLGRLLKLVRTYQELKSSPDGPGGSVVVRKRLQEACGADETGLGILNRFAKLLRDEAFLEGHRDAAGRILVVDPDEVVTPVLEQPLKAAGFEVVTCGDGEAALAKLADSTINLVISEWKLPLLEGLALCEKMKADPASRDIPFVFITRSRSRNVAARCLQAGAEDVIRKPADMQWLILRARRLIETSAEAAAAAAPGPAGPAPAAEGVTGSLGDMGLTDMVQIVGSGGRNMVIHLRRGEETAEVYLQDGDVVDARVGDVSGEQAFFQIMGWEEGTFSTRPYTPPEERTIHVSVTSLLMEGLRRRDEEGDDPSA